MAYNAENFDEETIGSVELKNGNNVTVKKVTTKSSGEEAIDIRRMYTDDNGEVRPTSKGIRVSMECIPELLGYIVKALSREALYDINNIIVEEINNIDNSDNDE